MIWTSLCDLLGIEHPILQGGMAWAASAELAAAVSNAGRLGVVGAGDSPIDIVRRELRHVRSLTDRPFGANVPLFTAGVEEMLQVFIDEGRVSSDRRRRKRRALPGATAAGGHPRYPCGGLGCPGQADVAPGSGCAHRRGNGVGRPCR